MARAIPPKSSRSGPRGSVTDWLLEQNQPAVRYRALVDLLDRAESDPEVRAARAQIRRTGWAYDQLRRQGPNGYWERRGPKGTEEWINFLWDPKYGSTIWRAIVLAELGVEGTDRRITKIAELIFDYKLRLSCPYNFFYEEMCIVANTARMMTQFGYLDDRRIRKLYDWILEDQREDGGWNCSQGTPGTLDVWEPLAAFAAIPKAKRSAAMDRAVERGAEFYLKRKLMQEGTPYAPWLRFHYPNHYFYDLLIGLDVLTDLGYGGDRRLRDALTLLEKKRRSDGTWLLDRLQPDVGPGDGHRGILKQLTPLEIEPAGRPSKWITLKALRVLKRVERAT
jgi:hypothetical protein